MDKKMKKILLTVAAAFAVLIILLLIVSSCSKKKFDFTKFQDEVVKAAEKYYKGKSNELPENDGDKKTITLNDLISSGYLKDPVKKYKNKSLVCDGSVTVLNNTGFYIYTPSITCGKDYQTKTLFDQILDDSLAEEGIGLYKVGEQYIFKGEVSNNFVKVNGTEKLFRIIRINEDGTIRLMETKGLEQVTWDNRYNYERQSSDGINDYIANKINSRVKDSLANYLNDDKNWTNEMRKYVLTQNLCIGKRTKEDTTKDGSTECSTILDNQKLGLLNVYEYIQASLDNNCSSTADINCKNYNWLSNRKLKTWTITGLAEETSKVWYKDEYIKNTYAASTINALAVFNIPANLTYIKGNGTETDPYILR